MKYNIIFYVNSKQIIRKQLCDVTQFDIFKITKETCRMCQSQNFHVTHTC